jgi:hypothetical protein
MTIHSYPVNDLIEHELRCDACVCGPELEYVDGGGLLVKHHSLDGRELHEPDEAA